MGIRYVESKEVYELWIPGCQPGVVVTLIVKHAVTYPRIAYACSLCHSGFQTCNRILTNSS